MSPPRVLPIRELTVEQQEAVDKTPPGPRGRPRNLFLMLAAHPRLLTRFNVLAGAFQRGVLAAADREWVILRTAQRCGCEYEFRAHAPIAVERGLTEDDIAALRVGAPSSRWTARPAALIDFVDDLLDDDMVEDDVWDAVPFSGNSAAMLELLCLVGFYRLGACLINATRLPLDDE